MSERSCAQCRVGQVAGIGRGLFCPLITHSADAGDVLYREGDLATHAWYLESGVIALSRASDNDGGSGAHQIVRPGRFVGVEILMGEQYQATARVISNATLCGISGEGLVQWLAGRMDRMRAVLRDGAGPTSNHDSPGAPAGLPDRRSRREQIDAPEDHVS